MIASFLNLCLSQQAINQGINIGDFTVKSQLSNQSYTEEYISTGLSRLRWNQPSGLEISNVDAKDNSLIIEGELKGRRYRRMIQSGSLPGSIEIFVQISGEEAQDFPSFTDSFTPYINNRRDRDAKTTFPENKEISDIFFASPVAVSKSRWGDFALIPSLETIQKRAWPLSLKNLGLTFGYESNALPAPSNITYSYLIVTNKKRENDFPASYLWEHYARDRFEVPSPQSLPFQRYSNEVYKFNAPFTGPIEVTDPNNPPPKPPKAWKTFETESGIKVGAPTYQDKVEFTKNSNSILSALGLLVWGEISKQPDWIEKSEELINLYLDGDNQSTFVWGENPVWEGKQSNQDLAVTGFWLLKYCESAPDSLTKIKAQIKVIDIANKIAEHHYNDPKITAFITHLKNSKGVHKNHVVSRDRILSHFKFDPIKLLNCSLEDLPWTIRTLIALQSEQSILLQSHLEEAVGRASLHQILFENPLQPGRQTFGSFTDFNSAVVPYSGEMAMALLDAGFATKNKMWCHRGAIGLRSLLGGLVTGSEPAWKKQLAQGLTHQYGVLGYGISARDAFPEYTSFEQGSGAILGYLAESFANYGTLYHSGDIFNFSVDGYILGTDGGVRSLLVNNPLSYALPNPFAVIQTPQGRKPFSSTQSTPRITRIFLADETQHSATVVADSGSTMNAQVAEKLNPAFIVNGERISAKLGVRGFEAPVSAMQLSNSTVTFVGEGIASAKADLFLTPPLGANKYWPRGWKRIKDLADVTYPSLKQGKNLVISTADKGDGKKHPELKGIIKSIPFVCYEQILSFTLYGSGSQKIQLVDDQLNTVLYDLTTDQSSAFEAEWDLRAFLGKRVRIELVDESETGYIEANNFRLRDEKPE